MPALQNFTLQQIATDAFGNALGSSLADSINSGGRTLSARPISDFTSIGPVDSSGPQVDIPGLLAGLPEINAEQSPYLANIADDQFPAPAAKGRLLRSQSSELKPFELSPLALDQPDLNKLVSIGDIRKTQTYESGTETRVLGQPDDFNRIRRPVTLGAVEDLSYRFVGSDADIDARSQEVQIGTRTVRVIYPRVSTAQDSDILLPSVDSVARALGIVDDQQLAETRSVVLNPNRNPLDARWETEYGIPGFRSQATAGAGVVNFYPTRSNGDQSVVDATLIHETAHLWSQKLWLDSAVKQTWATASLSDARYPSTYARSAAVEDFAESIVMYRLSKGQIYGKRKASAVFTSTTPASMI